MHHLAPFGEADFLGPLRYLLDVFSRDDAVARHDGDGGLVLRGLHMAAADRHDDAADVDLALVRGLLHGHFNADLGVGEVDDLPLVDAGRGVDALPDDPHAVRLVELANEHHRLRCAYFKCRNWGNRHLDISFHYLP